MSTPARQLAAPPGVLGLLKEKVGLALVRSATAGPARCDPVSCYPHKRMTDPALLRRITVDPQIFGGKPTIRQMRISVELVLSLLAQGESPQGLVDDYPGLELDDVRACIAYAHAVIANDSLDAVRLTGS